MLVIGISPHGEEFVTIRHQGEELRVGLMWGGARVRAQGGQPYGGFKLLFDGPLSFEVFRSKHS